MTAFGRAALEAARIRGRGAVRRRLFVAVSLVLHLGALVVLASARPADEPLHPSPDHQPVLLQPALPRPPAPAPPPTPRPVPRRKPIVQPPALVQPPAEPPPPIEPGPIEEEPSEPEATDLAPAEGPTSPVAGLPVIGDRVHELREVARAPVLIERVVPEYPAAARAERIVGLVVVRVVIGLDGRVEPGRAKVVRSVPALDGAAIAAIERWRFSPAVGHGGQPVRVVIEVPFQFRLR